MAAWPTVADVKSALNVTTDSRDDLIAAALGAAIEQVGIDVGYTDVSVADAAGTPILTGTFDEVAAAVTPNYSLSNAALILAVMTVKAPDAPFGVAAVFDMGGMKVASEHPTYLRLLAGSRKSFAVG